MQSATLLRTIAGSRLYGLHHEDSDWDYFTVIEKPVGMKKAKYNIHEVTDKLDFRVLDFGTWMEACKDGQPQSLEAMFSQQATVDRVSEFRNSFVYAGDLHSYQGVIDHIAQDHPGSYKHKRHVLRLCLNMRDLRERGRFNPTLTADEVAWVNKYAAYDMDDVVLTGLARAYE